MEILQGIKDSKQFDEVKNLLTTLPFINYSATSTINLAIDISREYNFKTTFTITNKNTNCK